MNHIPYVELHLHTEYSIMDGLSTADEYCRRAAEIGIEILACTDHSTTAGHRNFLKTCNEHNIKAILGAELHFTSDRFDKKSKAKRQDGEDTELYYHLIALAKNDNGLRNLYKMEQKAWTEGFYSKPRVDFELLEQYHEDIIITSACVSGPIARNIINEKEDKAVEWMHKFKDLFQDDFYIEVQDHNEGISPGLNHKLLNLADQNGIKAVATSDCHHASPEDLWLQESILIMNTQPKKNMDFDRSQMDTMSFLEKLEYMYPERKMTFEHADVHLSNAMEKLERYKAQKIDRTDIYTNTLEVADKIG